MYACIIVKQMTVDPDSSRCFSADPERFLLVIGYLHSADGKAPMTIVLLLYVRLHAGARCIATAGESAKRNTFWMLRLFTDTLVEMIPNASEQDKGRAKKKKEEKEREKAKKKKKKKNNNNNTTTILTILLKKRTQEVICDGFARWQQRSKGF